MRREQLVERVDHLRDAPFLDLVDLLAERVPELAQHLFPVPAAGGDLVQLGLQIGGEPRLHVLIEEPDQEGGDHAAALLGHEAAALEAHVIALLEHRDDGCVRRRPTDAQLLELAHQARLGVAGRRLGEMLPGRDRAAAQRLAGRHRRQQAAVLVVLRRVVAAFLVELEKAVEGDGRAGGAQADLPVGRRDLGGHPVEQRARHLAGERALPDQLVQAALIVVEKAPDRLRRAAHVGRPDRLVRLLGVLGPGLIGARLLRQIAVAVDLRDLPPARVQRLARELHAVGAHVGDQADRVAVQIDALEQALGGAHGALGAEAELARRLLLQGGGGERRRRVTLDLLLLDAVDLEGARLDRGDGAPGVRLRGDVELVQLLAVEQSEAGLEGRVPGRGERRLDGPVFLRPERLDLVLALADQAQRHRLHAPGRARAVELAPQHRRQGEADQVVERAARLIGVDQAIVQVARLAHRLEHRALGDLVEHHPPDADPVDRVALLERGEQVPGDRLAFAVGIGRQVEVVGRLERPGDLGDPLLPVGEQLVDDPEVLVRPHRAVLLRQIAHVAVAGQDVVAGAQILVDVLGLGRGFDDDDVHARKGVPALRLMIRRHVARHR